MQLCPLPFNGNHCAFEMRLNSMIPFFLFVFVSLQLCLGENNLRGAQAAVEKMNTTNTPQTNNNYHKKEHYFPEIIEQYQIRTDVYSNEPVSRGVLNKVGGFDHSKKPANKMKFVEFKKALQCAPYEPDVDGDRGSISMLRAMPPKAESIELFCAWIESGCNGWQECSAKVALYKKGEYHKTNYHGGLRVGFQDVIMIRISNGAVYYDWPWGVERLVKTTPGHMSLLEYFMERVSDFPDCVFFVGGELNWLPYNLAMPVFAPSCSIKMNEMPWPWFEQFTLERKLHIKATEGKIDFHSINYSNPMAINKPWNERKSKCAFYGLGVNIRAAFFDQAANRPDLFEGAYTTPLHIRPRNILSHEGSLHYQYMDNVTMAKFNETNGYDGTKYTKYGFTRYRICTVYYMCNLENISVFRMRVVE